MTGAQFPQGHDARSAPRYPVNLPVGFKGGSGETRDISTGGVYFVCEKEMKVGSRMSLTITLQGGEGDAPVILHCKGPIVRVSDTADQVGVAMQFEECRIES